MSGRGTTEFEWLRKQGIWVIDIHGRYTASKEFAKVQRKNRFYINLKKAAN